MSTTPLTDSINALTTYANSVTGASDTTLSDAVYTLAQGFGGGLPSGWNVAQLTADQDYLNATTSTNWVINAFPNATIFFVIDETNVATGVANVENFSLLITSFIVSNDTRGGYVRSRNKRYDAGTNFSLDYSLKIWTGDTVTVFYK